MFLCSKKEFPQASTAPNSISSTLSSTKSPTPTETESSSSPIAKTVVAAKAANKKTVLKFEHGAFYTFAFFFLNLKIKLLKRIMFITMKNRTRIAMVSTGFCGARVARSIIGKPKTIAGKF